MDYDSGARRPAYFVNTDVPTGDREVLKIATRVSIY